MAAHSTKRNGRSEPKRDRSLQTLPRYAARSRHSPILHDVPLGFAASAGGPRRLAEPRSLRLFRGLRGNSCEESGRSRHRVGAFQHALELHLSRLRSRHLSSGPQQVHGFSEGRAHRQPGAGQSIPLIKAASSKATVGSAYGMAPAYPKTNSGADRSAAARYHAMNNVFFLDAAMYGKYPKAFAVETPFEAMSFQPGDEQIMKAPLDWIGFHYYTRRVVSDTGDSPRPAGSGSFGTEIEDTAGGRDPYTQFSAVMPTEGPLTDAGLEIYPRGIYDLVMQITREYIHPIMEITESGCGYSDAPHEQESGRVP